jgi:UDP-N-acetylmuramoylalanine--D-glutamate ligase
LGTDLVERPDADMIGRLLREVDFVAPAPGVPETHELVRAALAADVPLRTEIDLAHEWGQERPGGPLPMIAITGTDGKTTTTMLTASLLTVGGLRTAAVGNTEVPFVAALDDDVDAFAVECSSFRLNWIDRFRAEAAVWLNLAPDHQNWHRSMASYEAAKARIWEHQRPPDVAIGWSGDPTVMARLRSAPGRHVTFGLDDGEYRVEGEGEQRQLCGPSGSFASVTSLARRFPHDLTNALAASAACLEAGLVSPDCIDDGLGSFRTPPHRIEPLGAHDGVEWFNDSKATSPHAALTAIRSFESIVLIAGGRNKGLDLASLGTEMRRIRAVVAIGEAADEVAAAFVGSRPVERADSMVDAVRVAAGLATAGDTVLLSPACASFDWYPDGGYPARGDDFKRCVAALGEERSA